MRALVQRVSRASVEVDQKPVGSIGPGLLVFAGVMVDDGPSDLEWMARKLVGLRIFPDADGKMNRSVADCGGRVLLVSQFTLCADVGKGTRPSFSRAMPPQEANMWFGRLVEAVGRSVPVETGTFQAHMEVSLVNDGPVTIWLDSRREGKGEG